MNETKSNQAGERTQAEIQALVSAARVTVQEIEILAGRRTLHSGDILCGMTQSERACYLPLTAALAAFEGQGSKETR